MSVDSTTCRAHVHAAGARRDSPRAVDGEPGDHALGRSRGGWSTKIHAAVDAGRGVLACVLSAGQAADCLMMVPVLEARTCPVFCVSVLQVGVDSVGVGGGELGQGLVPVGGDLSFDELALGPALGCWQSFLLVAFSGSLVHGCRRSPATAA